MPRNELTTTKNISLLHFFFDGGRNRSSYDLHVSGRQRFQRTFRRGSSNRSLARTWPPSNIRHVWGVDIYGMSVMVIVYGRAGA